MTIDTKKSIKAVIVIVSAIACSRWIIGMDTLRVFANDTINVKPLAMDIIVGVLLGAIVGYVIILIVNMFIDFD